MAKNMDTLAPDASKLLATSSFANAFDTSSAASLSPERKWGSGRRVTGRASSLATTTVAQRFRTSSVRCSWRSGRHPHFIRCLKPNDANVPDVLEAPRLVEQLRYCGVLEAVRVARAGYPVRFPHAEFARRYRDVRPRQAGSTSRRSWTMLWMLFRRRLYMRRKRWSSCWLLERNSRRAGFRRRPAKGRRRRQDEVFLRKGRLRGPRSFTSSEDGGGRRFGCKRPSAGGKLGGHLRSARKLAHFVQVRARLKLRRRRRAALSIAGAVRVVGASRKFSASRRIARAAQTAGRGAQARRKLGWLRDAKGRTKRKLQRVARRGEGCGASTDCGPRASRCNV